MRNDGGGSRASPDIFGMPEEDAALFAAAVARAGIRAGAFQELGVDAKVMRSYLTALYYIGLQTELRDNPVRTFRPQGFFRTQTGAKSVRLNPFNLHLVMGTNDSAFAILARLGHAHGLISYYVLGGGDAIRSSVNGYLSRASAKSATQTAIERYVEAPIETAMTEPRMERYWRILEAYLEKE